MKMFQPKPRRRKKVHGNPFPKTKGTGIRYMDTPPPLPPRARTAEDIAAEEQARQQQAALEEQRALRQSSIDTIVRVADKTLRVWKAAADRKDQCLRDFPGWTTSDFCALPVDQEIAELYEDEFYDYVHHYWNRPITLAEMDAIVKHAFHTPRNSTEQNVVEATAIVRSVAETCCNNEGISVERFIEMLGRRTRRVKQSNTAISSALASVRNQMSFLFEKLKQAKGRA
jgi:hypothetical protein